MDSATLLTCPDPKSGEYSGYSWTSAEMDGATESGALREPIRAALRDLVIHNAPVAPRVFKNGEVHDAQWFVLASSMKGAAVAVGDWDEHGPGKNGEIVFLKHASGGWTPESWGKCYLEPALPAGHSTVAIDYMDKAPGATRELHLHITELECSSGRDPRPYLYRPTVLENNAGVRITLTVKPPDASPLPDGTAVGFTCIGVSPFPYTVHLARQLGDRTVLDGSVWPASKVKIR